MKNEQSQANSSIIDESINASKIHVNLYFININIIDYRVTKITCLHKFKKTKDTNQQDKKKKKTIKIGLIIQRVLNLIS